MIKIIDVNGKLLKYSDLGVIDKYQFEQNIAVSGTYMILAYVNGIVETKKLIVE